MQRETMKTGFRKSGLVLTVFSIAAIVAGCASRPPVEEHPRHHAAVTDILAKSAARATHAQETLAMIQRARTEPAMSSLNIAGLPPELVLPATMKWSGHGEDAVRRIAQMIGYEFRVMGNRPPQGPNVQVDATDQPVAKVLEDVGLQIQADATLNVDPNLRVIEFRYSDANLAGNKHEWKAPRLSGRVTK